MICNQCRKFFFVDHDPGEKQLSCPHCGSVLTATHESVLCRCEHCGRKLKIDAWMEGEESQCPSCHENTVLRSIDAVPAPSVAAEAADAPPPTPRFRSPGGLKPPVPASSAQPAATPRPAVVPPPVTRQKTNVQPTLTLPPRVTVPPVPTPAGAAETFPAAATAAPRRAATAATESPLLSGEALDEAKALAAAIAAPLPPSVPSTQRVLRSFSRQRMRMIRLGAAIVGVLVIIILLVSFQSNRAARKRQHQELLQAVEAGDGATVERVVKNASADQREKLAATALDMSVSRQQKEPISALLAAQLAHPDSPRTEAGTLLDLAAAKDREWLLDLLIDSGTDLNARLSNGSTLLTEAIRRRDIAHVEKLLKHKADANAGDERGIPAIFAAVDSPELVKLLVETGGAKLNVRDWNMNTPLLAALAIPNYPVAEYLLSQGDAAYKHNLDGDTPLLAYLRHGEGQEPFFELLLKQPCLPNAANRHGETAVQIVMKRKLYDLLLPLAGIGAREVTAELLKELLPDNPDAKQWMESLRKLSKTPIQEQKVAEVKPDEITPPFDRSGSVLSTWRPVVFWLLWVMCGLVALRLLKPFEESRFSAAFLAVALFAGPLFLIGLGCCKGWLWIAPYVNRLRPRPQYLENPLRFFALDGEERLKTAPTPESEAVILLLRAMLERALANNCDSVALEPGDGRYQVVLKRQGRSFPSHSFDSARGREMLSVLKSLADLNVFEEVRPQSGSFRIVRDPLRVKVTLSTVGLGSRGERALLSFRAAEEEVRSFNQLALSRKATAAIDTLIAKRHGLVIVAGEQGNGRRTFVSLLLEEIAVKLGSAVWIGDGTEPAGSDRVPRLKTDTLAKITPEQLMEAMPDCVAAAITIKQNDAETWRFAVQQAERKIIILVTDCRDSADALISCLKAGVSAADLGRQLRLVITPLLLHRLCEKCAVSCREPERLAGELARLALPADRLRRKAGCLECDHSGVKALPAVVYHVETPTEEWFLASSEKQLRQAVGSLPFLRSVALCLAAKGQVSLEEIEQKLYEKEI